MSATGIWVGKVYFGGVDQGWSESYWMQATTSAAAKTALAAVITARKACLHTVYDILYSYVSQLGVNRDSFIVGGTVVNGSDTVVANIPEDAAIALLLRQESAEGNICNRYLHGVPKPSVVNREYIVGGVAAFDTALAAYITALTASTGYLKKTPANPGFTYTIETWGTIVTRGATRHKVGKPFDLSHGRRATA